jgi:hypothetical protein
MCTQKLTAILAEKSFIAITQVDEGNEMSLGHVVVLSVSSSPRTSQWELN